MLSPEQIAKVADLYVGTFNRTVINRLFREQDESHLYPINGRFNATDAAIRRLQRLQRDGLVIEDGLEYALALDEEISRIVNGEV
jgi:hypothetical protein